jgi:hypothetical protein
MNKLEKLQKEQVILLFKIAKILDEIETEQIKI